jgi:hypothetical protein
MEVMMSDKTNPRDKLQNTLADLQGSIGAELAELQSGNLPADPYSDFYDQQGKALSSASALHAPLAAHDIQLLLAVAKHRKREHGDKQGYSPIPDVAATVGFSAKVVGKAIKRFEAEQLVILSSCRNWAKLIDLGLKVVDDVMQPWREVIALRQQVSKLTSVLEAFHIDVDAACEMVGTPEHLWLQRAGLYGAALIQSFGKLTPDMHNEDSSQLMKKWLWELPGYTAPETGAAERHQSDVNERRLQPLIKSE